MQLENRQPKGSLFSLHFLLAIAAALSALTATFVLVGSTAEAETKSRGFIVIIGGFLIVSVALHVARTRSIAKIEGDRGPDLDLGLQSLDEDTEFFAGSIKPADLFRVLASRLRELVPFQSCALVLWDVSRSRLRAEAACDRDMNHLSGDQFALEVDTAGQCLASRSVVVAPSGAVAVPLFNRLEPFAVLQFCLDRELTPVDESVYLAIGTRVSPLVLRSLAFERSLSNALTDATTDLPNERALYLILENQIAECQRKREGRPLAVLALDIAGFDGINTKFGHASGDRILYQAAEIVKDNLRQMDFLARCNDDEFFAVLPTASRETVQDIVTRISAAFFGRRLRISDQDAIEVQLNIGTAAFGDDGETPRQLIAAARLRKEATKVPEANNVVWFSDRGPAGGINAT